MTNVSSGSHAALVVGKKASTEPPALATAWAASTAASLVSSPEIPPTAATATIASAIAIDIFTTNCSMSVTSTDHSPPIVT